MLCKTEDREGNWNFRSRDGDGENQIKEVFKELIIYDFLVLLIDTNLSFGKYNRQQDTRQRKTKEVHLDTLQKDNIMSKTERISLKRDKIISNK